LQGKDNDTQPEQAHIIKTLENVVKLKKPALSPCDFHVFGPLNKVLKGYTLGSGKDPGYSDAADPAARCKMDSLANALTV
jgi:hypothetical protein